MKSIYGFRLIAVLLLSLSACKKSTPSPEESVAAPTPLPMEFKNEPLSLPSGAGALAPALFAQGPKLLMVWLEKSPAPSKTVTLKLAESQNGLWGNTKILHTSDIFFANWADTPSVTMNSEGTILVHWAEKSGEATYAYDVRYGLLTGDAFKNQGILHQDKTQTEHGFVSVTPNERSFEIVWLDGRNTGGGHHGDTHNQSSGAMTLRHTTLSPSGLKESREIDNRVCDCCNTSTAQTDKGLIVAYRDRSNDEIRDISIAQSKQSRWSPPMDLSKDGWKIEGCPVNGPKLATSGQLVAAAWYTKATGTGQVKVKFSKDGGDTWTQNFSIDDQDPIGRVDLLSLPNNQFVISWLGKSPEGAALNLRRIAPNGTMTPTSTIEHVPESRRTGIPRIALTGDTLSIVWTAQNDTTTKLMGRRLSWQAIGTPLLTKPPKPTDEATTPINDIADLKVSNRDGQLVELAANGQHQLVAFWADWCRPCWEELPVLETLRTQHGLKVTLVTTHHADVRGLESSIQDRGFKGPVYYVDNEDFPAEFQLNQLPTSWVVNKNGGIESRLTGLLRLDDPIIVKVTMGKR